MIIYYGNKEISFSDPILWNFPPKKLNAVKIIIVIAKNIIDFRSVFEFRRKTLGKFCISEEKLLENSVYPEKKSKKSQKKTDQSRVRQTKKGKKVPSFIKGTFSRNTLWDYSFNYSLDQNLGPPINFNFWNRP
jgi:hypothetical protein